MSEGIIKVISFTCIFTVPSCLISILVFIYYSKEQKTRLFQAQVEAEAKAFKTRETMLQFVEEMMEQYNDKLKDLIKWLTLKYGIDEAIAMKKFGEWKPYVPKYYYDKFGGNEK